MAASRIREVFEQGSKAFNGHDIEALGRTMTEDVRTRAPGIGEMNGKQAAKAFYKSWMEAFPDAKVEVKTVTCTDDTAIEEGSFIGTQRGVLHGPGGDIPATGRKVRVDYIQAIRYQGDLASAFNLVFDRMELMEQLGLLPEQGAEPRSEAEARDAHAAH